MQKTINNKFEAKLAGYCIAATLITIAGLFSLLADNAYKAFLAGDTFLIVETVLFAIAMVFVTYGNMLYQICLVGYYKRREKHTPPPADELYQRYLGKAPSLSVLIPSYKEERTVNWQTMMSAALAEYPSKNVILLIDDPYPAKALGDMVKLEDTRLIPVEMQAMFDVPAANYRAEQESFKERSATGYQWQGELVRLANHYDDVAVWLNNLAVEFAGKNTLETMNHADRFFIEAILDKPASSHNELASKLRGMVEAGDVPSEDFIACHYARLAGLFNVRFSSFERKKYTNLSHEANKAMNLNSYMGLIGKCWKEVEAEHGLWQLVECAEDEADLIIPDADYINTIDSDSLMLSEYALRLIHIMEEEGNQKLAVIQSPCSSFPGCPKGLERTAGACIDVQFLTHQGYTHWNASFWVGANAMLRRKALEEIKELRMQDGNAISIYIQDRTVIEDTESTIDLVHKGWKLYNYPERMTFSATPPDFGSLLIQRRRWSNGGLLILPKLFNYVKNSPKNLGLAKELFMRFHYLASTTTGCAVAFLFCFYPFSEQFSTFWLPLSVVPFFVLYTRDLKNAGYDYSDAFRICAMNLMLFPIVTGGVLKSFEQIITGKKIPFSRTPKIPGRTAAPALYSLIAILMPLAFAYVVFNQIRLGHEAQAVFAGINTLVAVYALVNFVGVKAAMEDMLVGIKTRWRASFYNAEILQIPTGQPSVALVQNTANSKR